jgi:hypothetical protein
MIERIKQIIEDEQLKKNCNRPEKVYRRWFFYCYLRNQKFYLREIAEIFVNIMQQLFMELNKRNFLKRKGSTLFFAHKRFIPGIQ